MRKGGAYGAIFFELEDEFHEMDKEHTTEKEKSTAIWQASASTTDFHGNILYSRDKMTAAKEARSLPEKKIV